MSDQNSGGSGYLEEAAALLRKSAETNEERYGNNPSHGTALMEGRERIANQFATLAAIDKGLLPADLTKAVLDQLVHANT